MIGDDTPSLGSPSNPILIHDEEGGYKTEQTGSDANTELMLAPEFWDSVMNLALHMELRSSISQRTLSRLDLWVPRILHIRSSLVTHLPLVIKISDDSSSAIGANERSVRSLGSYNTAQA